MTREQMLESKKHRDLKEQQEDALDQTDCLRAVYIVCSVQNDSNSQQYEDYTMDQIAGQLDNVDYSVGSVQ